MRPQYTKCGHERQPIYRDSANHSDSSGLARSLALSFSRVVAARRIPVLPHVLLRNSGFLARANTRAGMTENSTERTCVSLSCAGLNKIEVHSLGALVTNLGSSPALHFRYLELAPRAGFEPAT